VLLLSSRPHHVVPSSSGDVLEAGVGGPSNGCGWRTVSHVATLDNDADELRARVLAFVAGVLS